MSLHIPLHITFTLDEEYPQQHDDEYLGEEDDNQACNLAVGYQRWCEPCRHAEQIDQQQSRHPYRFTYFSRVARIVEAVVGLWGHRILCNILTV